MDPSLKETEYDVLIVGTGMAEAILAGALARAGKKVLHLDQNDYYGSNYASFPLTQFIRWTKNESAPPNTFDFDDAIYGEEAAKAAVVEPLPEHMKVIPIQNTFACHLLEAAFADLATQERLQQQSNAFSIDINPRLVLSSEELVEILITSGVGRYLEFAAIERTYVHFHSDKVEASQAANGRSTPSDGADTIWEVPCSKKDVFQSKLLGMVEKRMLMKFLQFVADYGETHILGEDVKTKNERSLALGRSLKRPQNKTNQVDDGDITPYLDQPFQNLLEKHFKLSPKLQQVVVYCVALASFPVEKNQMTARDGLAAVYRYVASIGRFTGTAFLVPLYGVSEITQSFCRLSAVYGGIYILRAPITNFVFDPATNEVVGIQSSDGGMLRGKHVVTNGSYVTCMRNTANSAKSAEQTSSPVHGRILRGVFVLTTSLRDGMNRVMIVIPPEDREFENPFAIQVVQLDGGAYACPRDCFLVQISMTLPSEWIDQEQRQRELMNNVIKRLITSALIERKSKQNPVMKTHANAAETMEQEEGKETTTEATWTDLIAWKAVFSMDHLASTTFNHQEPDAKSPDLPANVWVCETSISPSSTSCSGSDDTHPLEVNPLEIHLESASANARAIFNQLCPNEAFLPKSASAEQAEKEEMEDEHDAVLEAAQKLAKKTHISDPDLLLPDTPISTATRADGQQESQADVQAVLRSDLEV